MRDFPENNSLIVTKQRRKRFTCHYYCERQERQEKNYLLSNMRRATMVRTSCEEGSVGFLHLPNTRTQLNIVVERGLIESQTNPGFCRVRRSPDPDPTFSWTVREKVFFKEINFITRRFWSLYFGQQRPEFEFRINRYRYRTANSPPVISIKNALSLKALI